MSNEEQGPMENILEGLDEQSGVLSFDELKEELGARGIDIGAFLGKLDNLIAEQDKRIRLAWMQAADEKKAALRVAETPSGWITRKQEEILTAFAALSASHKTAVAFRNKDTLSLEDMAKILDASDQLKRSPSTEEELNE